MGVLSLNERVWFSKQAMNLKENSVFFCNVEPERQHMIMVMSMQ